ncbi:MAG: TetR/AcrR family transcriptional regulator [Ruminococcus sp.]|nr:TetR/AcrR family transcriptional regulator [Ruminococcus sp.]
MSDKTDLRILKTKNNLYQTLENLLKEKPFEEIKVSDICNAALINRSTFYAHYNDKYELLEEFFNTLKSNLSNELNKNTNIKNSKEYYLELIKLLLDHIESKIDTYKAIMINNRNSITMDIFYEAIYKDIIKQIDEISNSINNKIPSKIISDFYLGAVVNVCMEWIKYNHRYTKQEIIDYLSILLPNNF